jgi:hypothetical protein
MPELIIFIIAIIVACAAIYYLSAGIPAPWNWAARGIAIVIVLWWLGRILRLWMLPLVFFVLVGIGAQGAPGYWWLG